MMGPALDQYSFTGGTSLSKKNIDGDLHKPRGEGKSQPAAANSNQLVTKPIFRLAEFLCTELQPTDSESSAFLRAKPTHQWLDFLCHPIVDPPNPASFASNRRESGVLTGLVRHQNEAPPRCGSMRSTF
jgi:hypothetical protein